MVERNRKLLLNILENQMLKEKLPDSSYHCRHGSRGGANGAAAPPFVFLLIIIHIIHCYTHYFNLQARCKDCYYNHYKNNYIHYKHIHSCKIANTGMAMAEKIMIKQH